MDDQREKDLAECYRLLDETGRLDECLARYPELEPELRAHLMLRRELAGLIADPDTLVVSSNRRIVLSSLQPDRASEGEKMPPSKLMRFAGALVGAGLFAAIVLGAGAAPGGIPGPPSGGGGGGGGNDNGGGDQGTPVVQASGTPTSPLATATPGGGEATGGPTGGGTGGTLSVQATGTPTHGQVVSQAVHDAIASTTPGPGRGIAVSEAACTAAHDRTTLPQGAQNAPGQEGREPKDCTHPNADGTPGNGGKVEPTPEGGTITSSTQDTSGPGNSGSHGQNGNQGNGKGGNPNP